MLKIVLNSVSGFSVGDFLWRSAEERIDMLKIVSFIKFFKVCP